MNPIPPPPLAFIDRGFFISLGCLKFARLSLIEISNKYLKGVAMKNTKQKDVWLMTSLLLIALVVSSERDGQQE